MGLRLPLEMSPGREAACRAVFGTWVFFFFPNDARKNCPFVPEHMKLYRTGVFVGDKLIGTGEGRSKKAAEQQAAYAGIRKIRSSSKES